MASDDKFRWGPAGGFRGTAFNDFVDIALPNAANGVEVIPALAGHTIYVTGYMFKENAGGAQTLQLEHGSGAVGNIQIGGNHALAANQCTVVSPMHPSLAGAVGVNVGVLGTVAAAVAVQIWGYYAIP